MLFFSNPVLLIWTMGLGQYIYPSSLVVKQGFNLDTIVYLLLSTIFNPINQWIFYYFGKVSKITVLTITFLWICRYFNLKSKQCNISLLKKKTILITGGVSGLGLEIVKEWNSRNDVEKIIVIDVKKPGLYSEVKLQKVKYIQYDFSNLNLEILDKIVDLSTIDILICNAGMRQLHSIQESEIDNIKQIINVNWISHLLLTKQFIKTAMNKSNVCRFHIVVIGSVLGFVGPKNLGIYAGTKDALMAMMDSLREELPNNIVLTTILPGQLDSKMFEDVIVNKFLAPIIDTHKLALRIINIVDEGLNGTFAYPLYGRFLPVYRILPWFLQRFCRWFSGMDDV